MMEARATRPAPSVPPRTAVILFRDSSRGTDTYTQPLLEDHDAVESISVLQHQDLLTTKIIDDIVESHTGDTPFAALVFTSQNAVKALGQVLSKWMTDDLPSRVEQKKEQWDRFISLPIFVVGGTTATACRSTLLKHLPCTDVRGEATGGASAMLPVIIEFCTKYQAQEGIKPRLVFFCGDQRRDTLPDGLRLSNAADLLQVVSYATVARDPHDTRRDLIRAIERIRETCLAKYRAMGAHVLLLPADGGILIWMVFFSPSGVRVVAPLLADLEREHVCAAYAKGHAGDNFPLTASVSSVMYYGLAAIGATTRDELVTQLPPGLIVLAKEPSVQGIRMSLCEAHVG